MVSAKKLISNQRHIDNLAQKGIIGRFLRCTDQQWAIIKTFFHIIKKIEKLDKLIAIDISDDEKTFTLIFQDGKIENF